MVSSPSCIAAGIHPCWKEDAALERPVAWSIMANFSSLNILRKKVKDGGIKWEDPLRFWLAEHAQKASWGSFGAQKGIQIQEGDKVCVNYLGLHQQSTVPVEACEGEAPCTFCCSVQICHPGGTAGDQVDKSWVQKS